MVIKSSDTMRLLFQHCCQRILHDPRNSLLTLGIFFSLVLSSYQRADGLFDDHNYDKRQPAAPVFRYTETNITVGPGDRAILKCRVDNLGTKKITWRKSGDQHPLTIGFFTFVGEERISVDYNQRTREWSLIIRDVKPEDEGIYICTISTKEAVDNTYEVKLTVKSGIGTQAVQVSTYGGGSNFIAKGKDIRIQCTASGKPDPPADVEWYKTGKKIESDSLKGIYITKQVESKLLKSILEIKDAKMSDEGFYTCLSSNKDAEAIQIHILDVENNPNVKRGSGNNVNAGAQVHGENGVSSFKQQPLTLLSLKYTFFVLLSSLLIWSVR